MNPFSFCLKQVVGIIFLMLLLPSVVPAASFDCSKAASDIEKIICNDDELSKLDESLEKAYLEALKWANTKGETIKSQKQWLKYERNTCKDVECIKKAYETRIEKLESLSSSAPSAEVERPKLMTESLYSNDFYARAPSGMLIWSKILLELKIPCFAPRTDSSSSWKRDGCNYKSALATLHEIQSQLGKESQYLKIWATNQERVLLACAEQPGADQAPIRPTGKSLPRRAEGDFLYQLGSWNFYRKNYEAALSNYEQAEKLIRTPQQAKAAYMVVRTLAYLDRAEDAYHKIGKILSNPSLQLIHEDAKNYRFVIMSNSRSFALDFTPELAIEHLEWLQKIVRLDTKKTFLAMQAFPEQKDAFQQLDSYFPLYAPLSDAVDWWLTDVEPDGPKMCAVKTLAPKMPFIDWMQAKWAYNVFDYDWLWALHAQDHSYWGQNRNIVLHALKRWKNKKDGVWLQIAIQRVHPQDRAAQEILAAAEPFLDRPHRPETPEYRVWLFDLWSNAVRIRLGKGEMEKVKALVSKHFGFAGLLNFSEAGNRFFRRNESQFMKIMDKIFRWLIYTGQFEQARAFLDIVQENFKNEFCQWRSLLATNLDEAISVATVSRSDIDRFFHGYGNDETVWGEMLNLLPSRELYLIAADERIKDENRALIARTLFTRAILLDFDNDRIDQYAVLAGKLNPELREQLLESVADHNRDKYIGFLLKMPRFRPAVYLEYAENPERRSGEKRPTIGAIDIYNHNDNNWWCRFDDEKFNQRIFNAMKIVPEENKLLSADGELKPYMDNQRKLLAQHPYAKLVDHKEIELLKNIPEAPQYLSEAVINRELKSKSAGSEKGRNERAANLHRAVRTTRYGCNRNGSHGEYSKKAFMLLHRRYKDTPWAKATPYWFN